MASEPGEYFTFAPKPIREAPDFRDFRIEIDGKTLLLPAHIREAMNELDRIVAGKTSASEIFGFGLTKATGNVIEVIDFVAPNEDRMFSMDYLLINQDQEKLAGLLGATSLVLEILDDQAVIIPNDSDEPNEWMHFPVDSSGKINWSFADDEIQKLLGFDLPEDLDTLRAVITESGDAYLGSRLVLQSDWEVITTGGSVRITSAFMNRVFARAEEIGGDIGFSMHHHPSLALAHLLSDRPLTVRKNYYDELLKYSPPDVRFMHNIGVDFFEIRALGNPDAISDYESGTTSRFYRVEKILRDDPDLARKLYQ